MALAKIHSFKFAPQLVKRAQSAVLIISEFFEPCLRQENFCANLFEFYDSFFQDWKVLLVGKAKFIDGIFEVSPKVQKVP